MRTKKYLALLILAAVLGVVISFLVYWLLKLIADIQMWVFTDLPKDLGFHGTPPWWPLLPLAVAGAIVGAVIKYLPGRGGHSPADGFKPGGVAQPNELPGILVAAVASLGLGAVVGPEAPAIALGGGLAVLLVKLVKSDMPASTYAVIAAAGSFAGVSTLLGNPLTGAVLLLEASGLGGPMATIALIPGLLGAGLGSLIFLGLNAWTGYGTFSLTVPDLARLPAWTWPKSAGRWPSGWQRPWSASGSGGWPCSSARTWSGGCCCSPRWRAWPSPGWRSRSARQPGNRHLTCCSPARRR
jgi:H+/Cl- antiporter ClcA